MQALHSRLQPFLLFFIDGASFIDTEDTKWELLVATQQHAGRETVVSPQAHKQSAKLMLSMAPEGAAALHFVMYAEEHYCCNLVIQARPV